MLVAVRKHKRVTWELKSIQFGDMVSTWTKQLKMMPRLIPKWKDVGKKRLS